MLGVMAAMARHRPRPIVAQSCTVSVSPKIVAARKDFTERGLCEPQHVGSDRGAGFVNTLGGPQISCGSQTSCVRQKICFERASALALPLLLKKEERAGERRHFLSVSPLSDSLPARSSRGERAKPRKRFACRTQLVFNLPTVAREQRSADYKSAIRRIKNSALRGECDALDHHFSVDACATAVCCG